MVKKKYWFWEPGVLGAEFALTIVSILMIFITISESSIITVIMTLLIIGTFGGLITDKKKGDKKLHKI